MPHQSSAEDDDPVRASYPVYLTRPQSPSLSSSADPSPTAAPKLFLLQYPAFRPADAPYNVRNLQKPTSLRLKPATGFLELDIPVDTRNHYNAQKGSHYTKVLRDSRIAKGGGTHGLSGGFHTGSLGRNFREDEDLKLSSIPSQSDDPPLSVQTLGGKIVKPSPGDPIYMLGSFQNNTLHLSHLDGVIQVRPELHHLDAADELERSHARARGKDGIINGNDDMATVALPSTKPESKAIDIKLKPSSGPRDHDPSANTNAGLLRAIQQEPWQSYDWVDEDDPESRHMATTALRLPVPQDDPSTTVVPRLESAISNSTYLDLLSAPRIEHGKKGDKGLMSKVKGRERERQRRKRNDVARKERAATAKAAERAGETRVEEGEGREGELDEEDEEDEENRTAGEETAPDGGMGGPSDEESSEDDEQQHHHHHHRRRRREPVLNAGGEEDDVQMLDTWPNQGQQQVDGADEEDDNDEVQEIEKPEIPMPAPTPAPPRRGRGRPRKVPPLGEPIVVDD